MVYCTWKIHVLDFVHRLMFLKNTTFRNLDLFPFSGKMIEASSF
jgi:hypothetical protein